MAGYLVFVYFSSPMISVVLVEEEVMGKKDPHTHQILCALSCKVRISQFWVGGMHKSPVTGGEQRESRRKLHNFLSLRRGNKTCDTEYKPGFSQHSWLFCQDCGWSPSLAPLWVLEQRPDHDPSPAQQDSSLPSAPRVGCVWLDRKSICH